MARSTLQLLRFPFSYFLMPVYWFAVSFAPHVQLVKAIIIFIILHLLLYPSSNGYNSYMDRDETSIGGLKNPLQPTRELFVVSMVMDVLAILLSLFINVVFVTGVVFYIICSRLYSYRGVRLKQYPVIGYLTVILNQGALIFYIVWYGVQREHVVQLPWQGIVAAAFLIGGFYPITQVYQHDADAKDGVRTMSMLLGKSGTFIFCAAMYTVAFALLYSYYLLQHKQWMFVVLQLFFLPVIFFFIRWMLQVWRDERKADFKHTMQMNWIAGTCTNLAFITLICLQYFG